MKFDPQPAPRNVRSQDVRALISEDGELYIRDGFGDGVMLSKAGHVSADSINSALWADRVTAATEVFIAGDSVTITF